MLVFGDGLATTLSLIWAFFVEVVWSLQLELPSHIMHAWSVPERDLSFNDMPCCIARFDRRWHLQFYSTCSVLFLCMKACCLEYVCIALLLSLETVHNPIILDFGQTNHHTTFKRSIDLWPNQTQGPGQGKTPWNQPCSRLMECSSEIDPKLMRMYDG